MNISDARLAYGLITSTDQVEFLRSQNRTRISNLVNGFPPVDGPAAKKLGLDIVYNDLSALTLFRAAFLQFFNAFQSRQIFFNVRCPSMPVEKRQEWEMLLTEYINRPMKDSKAYGCLLDEKFCSTVMHGIGPQFWMSKNKWCGDFVALSDIRVPTDTHTSLDNLTWIARRVRYTVSELASRVFGKYSDEGWDKKAIGDIIKEYWDDNYDTTSDMTYPTFPEKLSALVRQNGIPYQSDAVPTIDLWHLYHVDQSNLLSRRVMMKVVPDQSVKGKSYDNFLFKSDKPVGARWDEILHVQFGDLNGEPPFMWHSVRSLGFMLHDSAFWKNLTSCRALQHLWENFQLLLQVDGPVDKMRATKVEMMKGVLPTGVRIVPQQERHQVESNLLQYITSQLKQSMGEASSVYTQDLDTGTSKEQTAFETMTKLQQVNALLGGLLNIAFRNETFAYKEICRRFCLRKSLDPDVREFQKKCERAKIPRHFIDSSLWVVEPEVPMGSGNRTLELSAATQLLGIRGMVGPQGQQKILNLYISAVTGDVKLANAIAPLDEKKDLTNAERDAELAFGTLMSGGDIEPEEKFNPIEQMNVLLKLASDVVSRIDATGGMASMDNIAGLSMVMTYCNQLLERIAQDEQNGQLVKQYGDMIGDIMNQLKAFSQRLSEQNQSQGDPETQAKAASTMALTEAKIQAKQAEFEQKMAQREAQFQQKMNQSFEKAQLDLAKQTADAQADMMARGMETAQKIEQQKITPPDTKE